MKRIVEKSGKHAMYGVGLVLFATLLWSCSKYKVIGDYSDDFARVQAKDGKWGYIDKEKNEVIPCQYEDVHHFYDGFASVKLSGAYGIIDKSGKEVLPCKYDAIEFFGYEKGLWRKIKSNGKYGVFDLEKDKEIIPIKYDEIDGNILKNNFYDYKEVIKVRLNNKNGIISDSGIEILPCEYEKIDFFTKNLIMLKSNDKVGFIDWTKKEIIPMKYDRMMLFNSDSIVMVSGNRVTLFDLTGKVINTGTLTR